jgi:hypothetical protein
MPQLLEQFADICATLFSLLLFAEALRRQAAAWPRRLALNDLFGDKLDAVAADPLFLCLPQSTPGPRCRFRAAADSDAALPPVARGKVLTN